MHLHRSALARAVAAILLKLVTGWSAFLVLSHFEITRLFFRPEINNIGPDLVGVSWKCNNVKKVQLNTSVDV